MHHLNYVTDLSSLHVASYFSLQYTIKTQTIVGWNTITKQGDFYTLKQPWIDPSYSIISFEFARKPLSTSRYDPYPEINNL